MKKVFSFIFIIFLLALGVFLWYFQKNIFSKEDLKLEILGPAEATLLEEVEYVVKFKNTGNFRLENPQLIFIAPENSLKEGQLLETIIFDEKELGEAIYPGQEKSLTIKLQLLGKENEIKKAQAILSYRPKGLKARYQSETSFLTTLQIAPLTFEFDFPSRIPIGKNFNLRINYFSNLEVPLSNLRCQIEYPANFEFISAQPPSREKTEWSIPILNKAQGGRIEILGKLSGEIGEAKIFRAKLGIIKDEKFVLLKEAVKGAELVKPFIFLRQEINKNPEYVASPGSWLHYEIYFKNIGDSVLNNLTLFSKLEGEAFDFSTIKSEFGSYTPGDNIIIFEWKRVPKLQRLLPMEEGKVDFVIKVKEDLGDVKEPVLRHKVFIGEAREEFVTKVSSKLEIVQKGFYFDEVFGNSGPLPPEVGKMTTYTILWQLKNYYSDVKDVKVKAKLPKNVELTGKIFPIEETSKFAFDSSSREIVWTVGDLERGSGVFKPGKTLAFQISFLPDESQRGKTPEIVSEVKVESFDAWTGAKLESKSSAIDISLPDDPSLSPEMKIVK